MSFRPSCHTLSKCTCWLCDRFFCLRMFIAYGTLCPLYFYQI